MNSKVQMSIRKISYANEPPLIGGWLEFRGHHANPVPSNEEQALKPPPLAMAKLHPTIIVTPKKSPMGEILLAWSVDTQIKLATDKGNHHFPPCPPSL
ncbi:MAG: hypothetical protein JJU11_07975 [Candidatus Sumerlaeia bacterium]|nr:hypothetical protein [Candidatus Sumerlaeia bacterium]